MYITIHYTTLPIYMLRMCSVVQCSVSYAKLDYGFILMIMNKSSNPG